MKNYIYAVLAIFIFGSKILGAEKAPLGFLSKHISPIKNISLTYECEISKSGTLLIVGKQELLVDFSNESFVLTRLMHIQEAPHMISAEKILFKSGRLMSMACHFPYKIENFNIENFTSGKTKHDSQEGYVVLRPGTFDGAFDPLVNLLPGMYTEASRSLQKKGTVKEDAGKILFTIIDSKKRKNVLSIDKNTGFFVSKEIFQPKVSKDGTHSYVLSDRFDITKHEIIDGVLFPIEFKVETHTPEDWDYNSDAPMDVRQFKIKIKKDSIKINQNLKDKKFELKIPVGYRVMDWIRHTSYIADGLAKDGSQEKLSDALEAAFQEAERQRLEVESKAKKEK